MRYLLIARDNDPAGLRAARKLASRAVESGIEVSLLRPVLKDFNADLRLLGRDVLVANLQRQWPDLLRHDGVNALLTLAYARRCIPLPFPCLVGVRARIPGLGETVDRATRFRSVQQLALSFSSLRSLSGHKAPRDAPPCSSRPFIARQGPARMRGRYRKGATMLDDQDFRDDRAEVTMACLRHTSSMSFSSMAIGHWRKRAIRAPSPRLRLLSSRWRQSLKPQPVSLPKRALNRICPIFSGTSSISSTARPSAWAAAGR